MRRGSFSVLVLTLLAACSDAISDRTVVEPSTGLRFLGGETGDGFARATAPRGFVFPADHGSHPDYRTEWWYFTGNLAGAAGRHFGFELTFFRYALAPPAKSLDNASAWRAQEIWMAHFALTDSAGHRFVARERLTRGALGLAGASPDPLRVWVKDWSASGSATEDTLSVRLAARDDVIALNLQLVSTVPHVVHGDQGLDAKGAAAGNASYYYSIPRLAADGSEYFGVVLEKDSSLTECVNEAIQKIKDDGTLDELEQKWLAGSAPVLE